MRKEKISTTQAYMLIINFILGTSLALTNYSVALQDTWISVSLAIFYATIMVIIYGSIVNRFPDMDLFQIFEAVFGKVAGKIISFLYTFYFLHLGALCVRNITEYIQVVSFPETPQYFTGLFIGLLAIYILKCGLEVIARTNKFLSPILLFITILTFVMAIPKADIRNFLPILYNGWKPVLKASFSPFAFPFGETVVFMVLLNRVEGRKKPIRTYLIGIYLGGLILLNVIIRNILVLGFPNLEFSNFPSYYAVTLIDIGNFIKGIELIVSINITVAGFIKVAISLLGACIGICRILNISDYKWVSVPMGLLMLSLSFILFDNTMHMVEWIDIYKYYALPFHIIIPLLIFVVGMFKHKSQNSTFFGD
ncbi:endospore germination permease [Tissierella sp. Yu-01]|uniref:GerAB/ArcD/ProY family transporter n=1 Tax=Tissierella sp. Yu-01 TaxID=3035694 RepID=UPI00240DD6F1|nr:endospore germination permease [Tissierella sp. Yu-01]WFA08628.1 endospore germination permease [Tissierella sp. Yu-01]